VVGLRTRVLEDQVQIINEIRRLNYSSTRLSVCSAFGGMQMGYNYLFDSYMNVVDKHQKGEGKGMRWIINIDKENVNLVKVFLKAGIRIRHVRDMPPMNFEVSDKEMAGTILFTWTICIPSVSALPQQQTLVGVKITNPAKGQQMAIGKNLGKNSLFSVPSSWVLPKVFAFGGIVHGGFGHGFLGHGFGHFYGPGLGYYGPGYVVDNPCGGGPYSIIDGQAVCTTG
jgi:hypothetical protein